MSGQKRKAKALNRFAFWFVVLLLTCNFGSHLTFAQSDIDTKRIAGQQLLREGADLYERGTKESLLAAAEKNNQALSIFRSIGYGSGEAAALDNLGHIQILLGNKQLALDYYFESLAAARAAKDPYAEGMALGILGRYYLSEPKPDHKKAMDFLKQGISVLTATKNDAVDDLHLVHRLYKGAGEETRGIEYFTHVLTVARSTKDEICEGNVLNLIGMFYWYLNDKPQALDYYLQALPLLRKNKDRRSIGMTLNNIGVVYFSLGEFDRARLYYEEDLAISRADRNYPEQVVALINLGDLDLINDSRQQARERYQEALDITRSLKDSIGEAAALSHICTSFSPDEKEQALACHVDSLKRARALKDNVATISGLVNAAFLYGSLQKKKESFDYFNEALKLSYEIGDHDQAIRTRESLGWFELDRGNLEQARIHLAAAVQEIEATRATLSSSDLRGFYLGIRSYIYKAYIHVLMQLHKQQPSAGYDATALLASERGRARSLLETLTETGANIRHGVDPALVERERSLQAQLNAKAGQRIQLLSSTYTEAEARAFALEIEVLTAELQSVKGQIRQNNPRYASLMQPTIPTLQQIQALLDPDSILLEYTLGDRSSYLWVVTSTSISSYQLPQAADIKKAAGQFYQTMAAQSAVAAGSSPTDLSLSKMLLGPVASQLGKKRLVIVADGALQYLPFGALPDPASKRPATYLPLILNHEIVSLPSMAALATMRREAAGRKPAPKELAIIADPVFSSTDERVRKSAIGPTEESDSLSSPSTIVLQELVRKGAKETGAQRDGENLARLPGSRLEAERVAAFLPLSDIQKSLGFSASRELVKSGVLSNYRKLLFSTHTLIDNIHPELTAIVLSLVDEQGKPVDGYLRVHEIYNLNLRADLVVLSSCASGLGKDVQGEGLIGLTRGFMYAGAPRVVVSLWNVDDHATAELMVNFFRGMLKNGMRPPEALRAAQLELLKSKSWSSPHYWAAFVLQGEWR